MKRNYSKPLFFAEEYTFSSSIAKCDLDIDTIEPLKIKKGETFLCKVQDNGHVFGGQNGNKGSIINKCKETGISITLFNDGSATGCEYDWDGRRDIVAQTGDSFSVSFFGNGANPDNHAPAYNGLVFLS